MQRYDIESDWDDPFDRQQERRTAPRFKSDIKIAIAVESGSARRSLVGPGLLRDLSEGGLYCATKHKLVNGGDITIRFSTKMCPEEMCMPKSFYGRARVVHTEPGEGEVMYAGIEFGESFTQNMEFALFLQHLETAALTS